MPKIQKFQNPTGSGIGSVQAWNMKLEELLSQFSTNVNKTSGNDIGGVLGDGKDPSGLQKLLGTPGVTEIASSLPEITETGIKLLGGKEATMQGAGDQVFSQATTSLWKGALKTGNPYAIAAAGVLKGADYLNRYAGKNTKKQGTDSALNTGAYQFQLSANAGGKTTLLKRGRAKKIDQITKVADAQNLMAANAAYSTTNNNLAAQNSYSDIMSKNNTDLFGNKTTNIFSAKKGAKLSLTNIKNRAIHNVKKSKNVIPEGALHARKNNYSGELGENVTDKGIPVISYDKNGSIIQHAEIENSEIIFVKQVSSQLEKWHKEYMNLEDKDKKAELEIKCGKFLTFEIMENTEDNVGLIETV